MFSFINYSNLNKQEQNYFGKIQYGSYFEQRIKSWAGHEEQISILLLFDSEKCLMKMKLLQKFETILSTIIRS